MFSDFNRRIRPCLFLLFRFFPQSFFHRIRDTTADGNLILLDQNGKIINVSLGGQIEIPEVVGTYLRRIVRNQHGVAQRLFPLLKRISTLDEAAQDPQLIIVDPKIAFGKPVIAGTGITTEVIAGRLTAGDTEEDLAAEYGRTAEEIRAAATFEGVPVAA